MTTWGAFWIGLGIMLGGIAIGIGLADFGSYLRNGLVQGAALLGNQAKYEAEDDE